MDIFSTFSLDTTQCFIFSNVDFNMLCAIHNGQYFAMLTYGHFSYFSLDTTLCILFCAHVDLFGMIYDYIGNFVAIYG